MTNPSLHFLYSLMIQIEIPMPAECADNNNVIATTPFWFGLTNPKWITLKVLYFCLMAGVGAFQLFMVLFFRSIGLTTAEIGLLEFLNISTATIARPIVGSIADKCRRQSLVLAICSFFYAFIVLLFAFFDNCNTEIDVTQLNSTDFHFKQANMTRSVMGCYFEGVLSNHSTKYALIILLRLTSAAFVGPCNSLIDALAYDLLGAKHRNLWGQQRMFGTIGFGVMGSLTGFFIDEFGTFIFCFALACVIYVTMALVSLFGLPSRVDNIDTIDGTEKLPFFKAVAKVATSALFLLNCSISIASGMSIGVVLVIYPQWLDVLGAPRKIYGFISALICIFELPAMFMSGLVIDRIGESMAFFLCFMAYSIRFAVSSQLTPENYKISIPFEVLHIFCYGLFYPASSRIAAACAHPGTSSTVQALQSASFAGVGLGSGILVGSMIFSSFGGKTSFTIYSTFSLTCATIVLILHFTYFKKAIRKLEFSNSKKRQDPLLETEKAEETPEISL